MHRGEKNDFSVPFLYILQWRASFTACADLVIRPCLWVNGNLAFSFPGLAAMCWPPSVLLLVVCICLEQVPDPVQLQHSQHRYGWEALGCSFSPPSFPGVPICVPAHPLPHGTCPSTSLVHSSSGDVHACLPPHTLPVVEPQ